MDCSVIQEDLIAYHFGAASDAERVRVETHLVDCTACLRRYPIVDGLPVLIASRATSPEPGIPPSSVLHS